LTLVNPDSGRAHKHPAHSVVEVAGAQLRVPAAEFGLTPSSEQRLGTPKRDPDDGNPRAG